MSKFKGSNPLDLVIVSFTILLGAAVIFGFYMLNIAGVVQSAYKLEYSTNLNAMGTEIVNILEHRVGGRSNMELLGADASLNSGDYLDRRIDYTLVNIYTKTIDIPTPALFVTFPITVPLKYSLMLDYNVGFIFGYGTKLDINPSENCVSEPPENFFNYETDDDEKQVRVPRFTFEWPGGTKTGSGGVTSIFGPRYIFDACDCHTGMDFAYYGPVHPVYPGQIDYVGWNYPENHNLGYGLMIVMKHWIGAESLKDVPYDKRGEPDFYTYYGHLEEGSARVSEEQWITPKQEIATTGSTGTSTGIHLHLEMRGPGKATFLNVCDFMEDKPSECGLFTERKPTYCGVTTGADKVTFDVPMPGAMSYKTKATGVLYKWS